MDKISKAVRSGIMSKIRGAGNRSTEWRLRGALVRAGISGWRLGHRSQLPGRPDFIFTEPKLALFVDGCFWHGCPTCQAGRMPKTNASFWRRKIAGNAGRDRRQAAALRHGGWGVIRIWEHQLSGDLDRVLNRIWRRLDG